MTTDNDHRDDAAPTRMREEILARLSERLVASGCLTSDALEELQHRAHWLGEPLDRILAEEDAV
ncbi:MAG: hypothetical protein JW951_07665, partial [Lentisphaerae bacterium]|nr:hypothetical protein [Lentisphaerota bacterium]